MKAPLAAVKTRCAHENIQLWDLGHVASGQSVPGDPAWSITTSKRTIASDNPATIRSTVFCWPTELGLVEVGIGGSCVQISTETRFLVSQKFLAVWRHALINDTTIQLYASAGMWFTIVRRSMKKNRTKRTKGPWIQINSNRVDAPKDVIFLSLQKWAHWQLSFSQMGSSQCGEDDVLCRDSRLDETGQNDASKVRAGQVSVAEIQGRGGVKDILWLWYSNSF